MKSTLRTSTLAAVLVAAFGAAGVALPAAAQSRYMIAPAGTAPNGYVVAPSVAPQQVVIERFVMRGDVYPGSVLRFRVRGTPGVGAYLEIPGIQGIAPMEEVRPGVYAADYVLRPGDHLVRAVATLKSGPSHVSSQIFADDGGRYADRGWGYRDRIAPEIVDITPDQGERVSERGWTRISARVADRGTGVQSVQLRVDGRDVSNRVRFDGDDVRYAEDLQPGRHVAELAVRDRAGNVTRRAWSFAVVDEGRRYGWGYGGGYGYGRW